MVPLQVSGLAHSNLIIFEFQDSLQIFQGSGRVPSHRLKRGRTVFVGFIGIQRNLWGIFKDFFGFFGFFLEFL